MADVISFQRKVETILRQSGDQAFMLCMNCFKAGKEPPGYMPVTFHDAKGVFVAALVCMGCEDDVQLEYGRVCDVQSDGDAA